MIGFRTLLAKEIRRFQRVSVQTVLAPVVTALLYLVVFAQALEDRVNVYDGVPYRDFLVPGLVMMSLLQNAFANSSSSLVQSKVVGNLVFVLLPPFSPIEFFGAYVVAAAARGIAVAVGILAVTSVLVPIPVAHPAWVVLFALAGGLILGALGVLAGIWCEKIDQLAAVQNFLIVPATFLSGVFYSIGTLPPFWQAVSHLNPFLYMIDGFRYGFFGRSDIDPVVSLSVVGLFLAVFTGVALAWLRTGYRLRH